MDKEDEWHDLRHHTPVFWKLDIGRGHIRDLMRDLPPTTIGIEDIRRHRRKATTALLSTMPEDWRPLSTDLAGLVSAYPVAWGITAVPSSHNIPNWRAAHDEVCNCRSLDSSGECAFTQTVNMLQYGWSPAWRHHPPPFVPRVSSSTSPEHRQALDTTIKDGLERAIISECRSPSVTSCGTFVVPKDKFSAEAMVWDLNLANAPQLFVGIAKQRTVFNYSDPCPVNAAAIKWPVRYPNLSYYLSLTVPGGWVATEDMAHSYQQLPLAEQSRQRLAFRQRNPTTGHPAFYEHHTAPWGFSPSGSAFMCVSAALSVVLTARGCPHAFYCDDAFITGDTKEDCERHVAIFRATCRELGVELNKKARAPAQRQRFLGFIIDTVRQCVSLAPERLLQIKTVAKECLSSPRCSRRKLKHLAGVVTWASLAIPGSKARTVSLHAAGQRAGCHRIKLTAMMKDDLRWWHDLAADPDRNGSRIFLNPADVRWATMISDAGALALGAHTATSFAWRAMTPEERSFSSKSRELLAVELALDHLGDEYNNRVVVVGVDNRGACSAINSGRAGGRDSDSIAVVRRIGDTCYVRGIELLALWTRRTATRLADAIADCASRAAAAHCFRTALSTHSSTFDAATSTSRNAPSDN